MEDDVDRVRQAGCRQHRGLPRLVRQALDDRPHAPDHADEGIRRAPEPDELAPEHPAAVAGQLLGEPCVGERRDQPPRGRHGQAGGARELGDGSCSSGRSPSARSRSTARSSDWLRCRPGAWLTRAVCAFHRRIDHLLTHTRHSATLGDARRGHRRGCRGHGLRLRAARRRRRGRVARGGRVRSGASRGNAGWVTPSLGMPLASPGVLVIGPALGPRPEGRARDPPLARSELDALADPLRAQQPARGLRGGRARCSA